MADAAGVGGGADVDPGPRPAGPVARKEVGIFLPGEVGQLVEADEIEAPPLVLEPVLGVLHGAEGDLRTGRKDPGPLGLEEPRAGEGGGVELPRPVDELRQLRVGLAEEDGAVMRDADLPQRLGEQRVGLPAPRRAAVEHLVLVPRLEQPLPLLRRPDRHRLRFFRRFAQIFTSFLWI